MKARKRVLKAEIQSAILKVRARERQIIGDQPDRRAERKSCTGSSSPERVPTRFRKLRPKSRPSRKCIAGPAISFSFFVNLWSNARFRNHFGGFDRCRFFLLFVYFWIFSSSSSSEIALTRFWYSVITTVATKPATKPAKAPLTTSPVSILVHNFLPCFNFFSYCD